VRWIATALLLALAALLAGGCAGADVGLDGGSRGYLGEERCRLVGLLPDPHKCPEYFKGRPGAGGGMPIARPQPYPYPEPTKKPWIDDHPCSRPESYNGFPCYNDPSGPKYIPPVPDYTKGPER
jgi:hypothetical protein